MDLLSSYDDETSNAEQVPGGTSKTASEISEVPSLQTEWENFEKSFESNRPPNSSAGSSKVEEMKTGKSAGSDLLSQGNSCDDDESHLPPGVRKMNRCHRGSSSSEDEEEKEKAKSHSDSDSSGSDSDTSLSRARVSEKKPEVKRTEMSPPKLEKQEYIKKARRGSSSSRSRSNSPHSKRRRSDDKRSRSRSPRGHRGGNRRRGSRRSRSKDRDHYNRRRRTRSRERTRVDRYQRGGGFGRSKRSRSRERNKRSISVEKGKDRSKRSRSRENSASKDRSKRSPSKDKSKRSPSKDKSRRSMSKDIIKRSLSKDIIERSPSKDRIKRSQSKDRINRSLSKDRVKRSLSKDRSKRSVSKERGKRSRSQERSKRSGSKKRSRSRDKRKRSKSRDRSKRSRSRERNRRSRSRDKRQRSRSRNRSGSPREARVIRYGDRVIKAGASFGRPPPSKPMTFKEKMRQQLIKTIEEGGDMAHAFTDRDGTVFCTQTAGTQQVPAAKMPPVPLMANLLPPPAGLPAATITASEAAVQSMLALQKETTEKTGVEIPKYYNPAAINPMKYAEQVQKRKLLWSKTKEKDVNSQWNTTSLSSDHDDRSKEKFRKLMGIKPEDGGAATTSESPATEEQDLKQKELFEKLDKEYQFARMTTHTHRGVGLGFGSSSYQPHDA